jgi:3-oxoacyl-[acyl-carrier-protein] synthase II
MRRVVVTGLGAVTPLGAGVEASWARLLAGRSGIRRLADDVAGELPAKVGGLVPTLEEDPEGGFDPNTVLGPKHQRRVDRFILFAIAAADEARRDGASMGEVRAAAVLLQPRRRRSLVVCAHL